MLMYRLLLSGTNGLHSVGVLLGTDPSLHALQSSGLACCFGTHESRLLRRVGFWRLRVCKFAGRRDVKRYAVHGPRVGVSLRKATRRMCVPKCPGCSNSTLQAVASCVTRPSDCFFDCSTLRFPSPASRRSGLVDVCCPLLLLRSMCSPVASAGLGIVDRSQAIFYMFYYTGDPKYRRWAGCVGTVKPLSC